MPTVIVVVAGGVLIAVGLVDFVLFVLVGVVVLVAGLLMLWIGGSGRGSAVRAARDVELRQATEAEAVERQVVQMAALQAAWGRAHPGEPMPAVAAPAIASSRDRTNTPALLSLIFGILGTGLVAVILGHVAKSQIRRTGEQGSGMATAGLVLGYIGLVAGIAVVAVYAGVLASLT